MMAEEETPKTPPEPAHQPATGKGEEKVKTEGKEPGRKDTGTTGAKRPTGESKGRDATGVNPKAENPIDPKSPEIPPP